MSPKERCGSMHLCTYMRTEKKTRVYTRLLPSACDRWWQCIRQSHGDSRAGAESRGQGQWCTHIHSFLMRSECTAPGWVLPCAEHHGSQNAGTSPSPLQHPILSTRRGRSKMLDECAQVTRLPRPLGQSGSQAIPGPGGGRTPRAHRQGATSRLSRQRRGARRGSDSRQQPPLRREGVSSLATFFYTLIFYIFFFYK